MAIVTAPASLSKIKSVFGGGNKLSEYVRGGSIVPNTAHYNAISASVNGLAISQFVGIEHPEPQTVSITNNIWHGNSILKAPLRNCDVSVGLMSNGKYSKSGAFSNSLLPFGEGFEGVPMQFRFTALSHPNSFLPIGCSISPGSANNVWYDFTNGVTISAHYISDGGWMAPDDEIASSIFETQWLIEFRIKATGVSIGTLKVNLSCGYED